jgi:dephospho-CoA kinase
MLLVGVTGGIGSGKTTVCEIFKRLGIPVFNADEEGRMLLENDEKVKKRIINLLGNVAVKSKLNRKKIASLVFRNKEKLSQLNSIIHPRVRDNFRKWASRQQAPLIIEEAAILFESGAYRHLHKIINISAPVYLRKERVMKRDKIDENDFLRRLANQWNEKQRAQHSDYVIVNDEKKMVMPQVLHIHKQLLKEIPQPG